MNLAISFLIEKSQRKSKENLKPNKLLKANLKINQLLVSTLMIYPGIPRCTEYYLQRVLNKKYRGIILITTEENIIKIN